MEVSEEHRASSKKIEIEGEEFKFRVSLNDVDGSDEEGMATRTIDDRRSTRRVM